MFDRIEIGRVGGQEEQFTARIGHQFFGVRSAAPRHFGIQPLPARRAAIGLMQPILDTAFVEVKNVPIRQAFKLPPKQPPLHLISFPIFYEFFLA